MSLLFFKGMSFIGETQKVPKLQLMSSRVVCRDFWEIIEDVLDFDPIFGLRAQV